MPAVSARSTTSKTHLPTVRAALYVRISRDKAGAGLGVDRQEEDCRALAARLGWSVVAVHSDNDLSAYSGKPRPGYATMLEDVRTGRVNGIIAWHADRLHRRALELEEFVALAEQHDLQVQTVTAGTVDLTTASGRMVARMLGAAAQHEIDHARERMKRAKAQAAADGKWRGGRRPYGYNVDGNLVEEEAKVIAECTAAVLAGRSLAALARELNGKGLTTSTGKEWDYLSLRGVLDRPRNAALVSKGRPSSGLEIVGPASWPAIVTEDQWRSLHAALQRPERKTATSTQAKWLLAGIAKCGKCGARMHSTQMGGTKSSPNTTRTRAYRCAEGNHLSVKAEPSDCYVAEAVAARLRDVAVVAALMSGDDESVRRDRERRAALTARLESFEEDYAEGRISGAQLQRATAKVEEELEGITERLALSTRRTAASGVLDSVDPGAAFLNAPLDVQRAVTRLVVRVKVLPSPRRGMAWTPERIDLEWLA